MTKAKVPAVLEPQELERRIYAIRGERVMLDADLARLYGVPTKALNQAVKRNRERFPDDFAYQLTAQELADLRSQTVTANPTASKRRYQPWVFTEHGVAMLSSVLNSPRAVQVNIAIMRAFVRMRRISSTPGELVSQIIELAKTVQFHDEQIKAIARVLQQMMEPPPSPPKRKIGFHSTEMRSKYQLDGQAKTGAGI